MNRTNTICQCKEEINGVLVRNNEKLMKSVVPNLAAEDSKESSNEHRIVAQMTRD
jgi:hypothetical protein